jgi:hypothetical protein
VYDATRDPESCGSPGKACDPLGKAKCSAATLESEPNMLEGVHDGTQLAAVVDYWGVGPADFPGEEQHSWAARSPVVQSKLAQARHAAHHALQEEFDPSVQVHQRTVVVAEGDVHRRTLLVPV